MLQRRTAWYHWLALLVIVLMTGAIRIHRLSRNSLWTDEFLSLECSSGWGRTDLKLVGQSGPAPDLISLHNARPWTSIWSSIGSDENHPPLYFILLRFWRAAFGDGPAVIRGLSVVASLVAIVLLFALGVNLHSPGAALWACLLMALSSPQVQQSQDARAYLPVTAACLAAALALVRIERAGPSPLRCLVLFTAALVAPLMHYMAFASLAAMVLYAAGFMRGTSRKGAMISLGTCMAVIALLWGPQMVQQHYRVLDDTAWLVDAQANHAWLIVQHLCSLPTRLFLDLDVVRAPVAWLGATAFFLPLFLYKRYPQVWLCWIWLMVPVLVALLIDLSTGRSSLSMIRYTLAAAPGLYLIVGILATQFPRTGWLAALTIALSCAMALPSAYESRFPDYREISRFIASSSRQSDPVVFANSRNIDYCNEALLSVSYYLADQKHPMYLLSRPQPAIMKRQLSKARHLCVIADSARALNFKIVPGLKIDRADLLVDIALAGTADPIPANRRLAQAKADNDLLSKLALGMR